MATLRRPADTPRHEALADRVLSAAGGLRAGLASEGPLPSRRDIRTLVEELIEVLFPESHRLGTDGGSLRDHVAATIASLEPHLEEAIYLGLHRLHRKRSAGRATDACARRAKAIADKLLVALPDIRAMLAKDVLAAFEQDPAASGIDEIVACYPGLYAIAVYRVAHRLLGHGAEVLPRMLTEHAHSRTGIDIHPGATIGTSFFIDHGTGIVIGETSDIGDRVRIYQGVTLGALSVRDRSRDDKPTNKKRHPTIEDDVTIYANATILGGRTVIGRGAVVGGNAWITFSVPAGVRVGVGT
jgi:serine O-acetyltransferase